jgi:hypothetical protein
LEGEYYLVDLDVDGSITLYFKGFNIINCEDVDWFNFAQDRKHCGGLANTAMNREFPKSFMIFLHQFSEYNLLKKDSAP